MIRLLSITLPTAIVAAFVYYVLSSIAPLYVVL